MMHRETATLYYDDSAAFLIIIWNIKEMNKTIEELCNEAYHLQTNISFQLIQFSLLILSIITIILILHICTNICIRKIFHINLRILLINLLAFLFFRSLVTIYRSSTFIYRMIAYKNQCSFLEESVICSVLTEFGLALQKSFRYAFVAITIERFIAMCCYQHYEKWRYPIALVFLPLTWIEMALGIKDVVLTYFQSPYIPRSYCSSILNSDTFFWTLTLEIPPLIVIFFLLLITRVISKRKMILHLETRVDTLSSRYQIRENMKTSKTMFIATIMYITISVINLFEIFLLVYFPPANLLHFAVYKEITNVTIAIFIINIPVLFIIRVDYMRNKAIKCLSYFGCHISNEVGDESMNQSLSIRQHIEIVHEIWNKKARS
ncbi:Serpentine receptor [Dirofilaria immitis]